MNHAAPRGETTKLWSSITDLTACSHASNESPPHKVRPHYRESENDGEGNWHRVCFRHKSPCTLGRLRPHGLRPYVIEKKQKTCTHFSSKHNTVTNLSLASLSFCVNNHLIWLRRWLLGLETCIHTETSSTCLEANQLSLQQWVVYQFPVFGLVIYEPVFLRAQTEKVRYEDDCESMCCNCASVWRRWHWWQLKRRSTDESAGGQYIKLLLSYRRCISIWKCVRWYVTRYRGHRNAKNTFEVIHERPSPSFLSVVCGACVTHSSF